MAATNHPDALAALLAKTPARLGIGRTGTRFRTATLVDFLEAHARARDAVASEVSVSFVRKLGLTEIATAAPTRAAYLLDPALGRTLAPAGRARLARCRKNATVQLALGDGLSSTALVANGGVVLKALTARLRAQGHALGTPLFVRNARVRVQDEIGEILRPRVFCFLIGERPGLATAESLSAYVLHAPGRRAAEPDRTVISNIHRNGVPPVRAARMIADLIDQVLAHGASGAALAAALDAEATAAHG